MVAVFKLATKLKTLMKVLFHLRIVGTRKLIANPRFHHHASRLEQPITGEEFLVGGHPAGAFHLFTVDSNGNGRDVVGVIDRHG